MSVMPGYRDHLLRDVVSAVSEGGRDVMLVLGLGAPLQEKMAVQIKRRFWGRRRVKIMTCGGFISQTALKGGDFYPWWIDRLNLRCLWRCYKEPHVIKRYLLVYLRSYLYIRRQLEFQKP